MFELTGNIWTPEYDAGCKAAMNKEGKESCPYAPRTRELVLWMAGYSAFEELVEAVKE